MKNLPSFQKTVNSQMVLVIAMLTVIFSAGSVSAQMAPPGNALEFTTNQQVNCGNSANLKPTSAITVEAWVKRTTQNWSGYGGSGIIAGDSNADANTTGVYFAIRGQVNPQELYGTVLTSAGKKEVRGDTVPLAWQHVAMVFDGTSLRLYQDGVETNSITFASTTITPSTNNFAIGGTGTSVWWYSFNGQIDEVRIWNDSRTQAEIKKYMNTTLTGSEANLAAYYQFDESSGTALPDIAGSNNGTLTNGPAWVSSDAVLSDPGNALDFDGDNDFVELGTVNSGDPLALAGSDFTIETWIKPTLTGDVSQRIVDKSDNTYAANGYALKTNLSGSFEIFINGSQVYYSADVVTSDQWVHVAVTGDGSSYKGYINGVLTSNTLSPTYEAPPAASANMRIGSWNHTDGREYNGQIDELRIWNDVRTQTEIQNSMYKTLDPDSEANLVAYYRFNQGGSTLTDYTANNSHGTLTNMDSSADWVASGITPYVPGNALDFDGTDDYVNIPNNSLFNFDTNDDFTVSLWVKIPFAAPSNMSIIEKYDLAGTPYPFVIRYFNGKIIVAQFDGSNLTTVESVSQLNDDTWHHISCIMNSGVFYLYVDGMLHGSVSDTSTAPTTNALPLNIGRRNNGAYYFIGQTDELRIWNIARTENEIQENMHKTLTGGESNLVAYYRFDEWNGITLTDYTSNNSHGTLTNMDPLSDWTASDAFNAWTGSTDTDWHTESNWSMYSVPTSSDNVGIPSGGNQPTISSAAVCSNLVIGTGATLTVIGTATLTIPGNFINKGTFTAGSGTVILNGGNQAVYGSTAFNNLTKNVASAATLTFKNGTTHTVTGALDIQGASGNLLSLRSDSDGVQWGIDPQGTRTISYIDVKDSNNVNASLINAVGTNSISSGNNTNWNFYDPVIDQGASVSASVDEDGAPLAWSPPAVSASDGDGDTLTWSVTSVASDGTADVSGTGASPPTFTYAPDADWNGIDNFEVQVADGNGGTDTIIVNVTVNPVNDTPSFAKGTDLTVNEDAGNQSAPGWATLISEGPADESGQTLAFNMSNNNTALFSSQPAINASGNLAYTPASDASGSATVTVSLSDDGGGADTS
ncbi:MAG: hypothetical protein GY795_26285, partial [Desulfobacterales bacterium]|nr:hypothetical protein [Desulfobacterales bacterium]